MKGVKKLTLARSVTVGINIKNVLVINITFLTYNFYKIENIINGPCKGWTDTVAFDDIFPSKIIETTESN